ncbi:MAG TPA: aminotransferase class V-fold PLP-dependent enzyme [Candidatus Limnocylindria bacterium]|nr:aminotransferase class V-fold PLP-dependent enzyme [Candidatus Limnocylindria bacterium]
MTTFDPATGDFARYLAQVGAALDDWLASDQPDALTNGSGWQDSLRGPVPEQGIGADATIEEFVAEILPNGTRLTSPASWAFITTGPTTVPTVVAAAGMIAAPQRQMLTAFNRLEQLSLEWLAQLCGLGDHMLGVYSSGGSTANLVALGAARQWALEQAGLDPAAAGLDGRRLAVYTSTQAHHTIHRSAAVLGMGRASVRSIPTDDLLRLDLRTLEEALREDRAAGVIPVAVVAAAGTTNTGAIDPIRGAGELAREFGAWFHVDGAYGLPGRLDDRVAPLYDGLDLADSAITDPHKWLGAPVGVAATFVRDRAILHRAFTQEPADYLEGTFADDEAQVSMDSMGVPYFDFGVELSAPPRGVMVWAILRELGVEGVRRRIVTDNDFARHVAERAHADPRLEVLAEPVLSICGFRYRTDGEHDWDAVNRQILRRLARETPVVVSSTLVGGSFVLRPCFINSRTALSDVDAFIDSVLQFGDELTA